MWKPGPAWPWKTGLAQDWPEWTGDLGQLYIAIKLASSKSTFLLAPPKQADTIIIRIPQGEKGTISFKFGEGEITLIEVTETWTANREQMQTTEQAREQSGCHQAPSLSHPGGEGRRWWAGLAIFILLLGCGLHETMQTEESSGLGQAQGWDWHGAGQVLTGSWQSILKTEELQQAPNPNGRRSSPPLPCFPAPTLLRLSSAKPGCSRLSWIPGLFPTTFL